MLHILLLNKSIEYSSQSWSKKETSVIMVSCFLSTNFLNDFWEWKRQQFMDRIQGNRTNVRLSWSYHSRYRDRQSSEAERISFSLSCCPRTRTEDWVAVSTRSFTASFGATSTISFLHFLLAVTFLSKYKISASLSLFVCTVSFRTEWTSLFQSIETNTDKQAVGYLSEERERERDHEIQSAWLFQELRQCNYSQR